MSFLSRDDHIKATRSSYHSQQRKSMYYNSLGLMYKTGSPQDLVYVVSIAPIIGYLARFVLCFEQPQIG